MTKISKRLLALVLTAAMLLSCISTTVFAAEESPNEPLHDHSEQSDLDDLAFVNGTACYVQYDLNNDGVLSGKDAVELLGRATLSDIYPEGLTDEYDFDKDGNFDADDALALLKIALWHPEDYIGNIHAFSGSPVWSWNDNGETVAEFRCACGEKTAKLNATLQEPVVKDATCTEAGFVETTASVEFLGETYTDTKTVMSSATGHTYTTEASCTESAECSKCGYELPAAGHNYEKTAEQSASCTTEATETYTCKDCGDEYTVKTGDMVHTYVYDHEELKEGETCVYVRKLKCTSCGAEIDGEEAYHHKYKASITEEATCSKTGVKTYTCTECGDAYTEVIPVSAEGHDWKETDTQNGVVNYKCNNCDATKSVVVADNNKVDVTALENGGEVQLDNNVSVTLDQKTTEQLNGQLTLNVSEVEDKNSVQMAKEYKDGSTIYSLTMSDEKGSVTEFKGKVTVRLPYTLQEGDDVDCIKVLYVNDAGEVKEIEGHYSNGYVIFTTNHFSYYTVTRLTPAQRCALYGHNDKVTVVDATCENGGYTVKYCARCTRVEKTDETAALGHDYTVTEAEATCTKAGSITKKCRRCDSALIENYPAIGHNWETETVEATCTKPGSETKTCSVCHEKQTKVLPQLEHKITDTVVPPTCTDNGYTLHKCADCAYSATDSAVAAKGHTYKAEWVWDESNYSARVTLTCDGCGDTVTADAAVAEVVDLATCTEGGTEAFEASYSHAGKVYTDSINIKLDPLGHDFGDWEDNGENHIHICGRCEAEETEDHIWDEGKITKEPTCGTEGNIRKNCRVCSVKKDFAIPATGEHNFEDGICTECGYNENDCNHYSEDCEFTEIETVDLSKHGFCGGILHIEICPCGKVHRDRYEYTDTCCEWNWDSDSYTEKEDGSGFIVENTFTCGECGAVRVATYDTTYISADSCDAIEVYTQTYRSATEEEFSISEQNYYEDYHRTERKFKLLGSSCGEGVLEQGICKHCGKVLYEETYYEHNTDANVERIILPDSTCGGEYYIYSCACGQVMECENCECCNWNEIESDEEAEIFTYKCDECNTVMVVEYGEEECDDCHGSRKFYVTMFNPSGEKIFDRTFEIRGLNHNFETVIALNGESCEDGYTVTKTCSKCGTVESFESNAHNTSILDGEIIDLSEHGFCGGILHIRTCPCGEVHGDYYEYTEDVCHWEWNAESYTEKEDGSGYIQTTERVCYECGAENIEVRDVTYYSAEDCDCHKVVTNTYRNVDGEEFIIKNESDDYNHNIEQEYTLLGESCEDGVTYKEICRHCGFVVNEYTFYEHNIINTETIDLAEHGFCGGILHIRTCACGLVREDNFEPSEGGCSFSWNSNQDVYTEKEDGSGYILTRTMHCHNCDAERIETRDVTYYSADSCEAYVVETNIYRNADGEEFTTRRDMNLGEYHDTETNYTLLGESCQDGVLCQETCRRCNRIFYENTYYEHRTFAKETVELPNSTCGGRLGIQACLCGQESYYYEDTNCRWEYYGYDDITNESKRICHECNAVKTEKYEYTEIDECHESAKRSITISNASGEVILDHTFEYVNTNHTYVYSAELHGDTCEDGYEVYATCKYCDYEDRYTSHGHYGIRIEQDTVDLSEHGFCGGIIHIRTCPCGLVRDEEYTDGKCMWSGDSQEDITTEKSDGSGYIRTRTMHCDNCDAERTETQDVTYKNDYNCEVTVVETNIYRNADGEEFTTSRSFDGGGWHINERTYEMLGASCEDGVIYKDICSHCGQITLEETYYNHRSEYNEKIELADTTCGGYYGINSCVCGEEAGYYSNTRCNWQSTGYDSDTDTRSYTCSECGATKTERDIPSETQDPCYYFMQRHITILDSDGTTVLDRVFDDKGTNHDYCVVSANAEGGNCENGFTVELQCDKCGKTLTKTGNSHQTFVTKIDLSLKGACEGTYLKVHACACGSEESANVYMNGCYTQYNNSEIQTNDDGTVSWSNTTVCRDCGLRREYTYVGEREDGSCEIIGNVNRVITLNDAVIYEDTHDFSEKKHESIHYIYEEGLSCTDGIEYQEVCGRCNEVVSTGRVSDHSMMRVVEEIDLGECGAACGGKLTVKSCLCGERQYARLENGDYCDFDRQYCEPWVDDAIESHDRYNAEYDHNEYIGSDAYDMLCAVSDPQPCGFRIRVADYWRAVPDNPCLLQNVQIWRIGYDIETDTWQREITVLGRIVSEHDFTLTEDNTVNDLGQEVNVTTRTCKNCDTTVTHETIRQNVDGSSLIIKETHFFNNGLDNDDLDKAYTKTSERVVHGTHTHETLDREDTTYKNGKEYWAEYRYTYNFDECTQNREYSNSNGYYRTYTEEYHCLEYPHTTIKESSCSQFGESLYSECLNCGKQNKEQILPTQHNWRFDSDRGIYYCNYCDLESVTGANGSIVMEDLTASHGNDTDFVIGYWNRNDIPVSYYVSVVLNELGEDAENDRVLNDIAFTKLNREEDGITAISFAKEDTLNKAKELVESLNYSGSYDIRFTFVPQYDDTTLDYAITLTGVTE